MSRFLAAERFAPIVAGLAGLAWFWAELAPQRTGFEDTDNPATGLAFLAAHPEAWQQAGLALFVAGLALVATVLGTRDRLSVTEPDAGRGRPDSPVAVRTISIVGLFAAAALIGMGCVRLSGGPVRYVQGLDQAWGEMAYTVTQFVGVQLLLTGGLTLLALWIAGVAWIGGRQGTIPRPVALLAIVPAARLVAIPGLSASLPGGLWIVVLAAIPAAFLWLVLLGAWPGSMGTDRIPAAVADPVAV